MGRYWFLWLLVLFVLSPRGVVSNAATGTKGSSLPRDNPLFTPFRQDASAELRKDLETRMTTVSIIMGLMALGVTVFTLVRCEKLSENMTQLRTDVQDADGRKRLAELGSQVQSLQANVDRLRQAWQADTTKLESLARRLESRIVELEQAHNSLGTVSRDLESLRDFRSRVEQIHAVIQKAFNSGPIAMSSPTLRGEEPPAQVNS